MKTTFVSTIGVCLAAALSIGTGMQQAQASTGNLLKVNMPYATQVGNVTLPAGEWTISDIQDAGGAAVLLFRASNGATAQVLADKISLEDNASAHSAQVSVQRTNGVYRLDKIWTGDRDYGYEVPGNTSK